MMAKLLFGLLSTRAIIRRRIYVIRFRRGGALNVRSFSDSIHGFSSSTGDWTLVQIGLHAHASLLRRLTDSLSTAASITDDACRQIHTNAGESCLPYENSTDHNFILDRHPEAENVWIVGGGSGHGFKHGPVMGEMAADAILDSKVRPQRWL